MISLDEGAVDCAARNSETIKNGRGLVLKNKFTALHISEDGTILFGEGRHVAAFGEMHLAGSMGFTGWRLRVATTLP